jgi:hypothetical protein
MIGSIERVGRRTKGVESRTKRVGGMIERIRRIERIIRRIERVGRRVERVAGRFRAKDVRVCWLGRIEEAHGGRDNALCVLVFPPASHVHSRLCLQAHPLPLSSPQSAAARVAPERARQQKRLHPPLNRASGSRNSAALLRDR